MINATSAGLAEEACRAAGPPWQAASLPTTWCTGARRRSCRRAQGGGARLRRPRDAGRAGRRILLHLARVRAADAPGARSCVARRRVRAWSWRGRRSATRWAPLVLSQWSAIQLWFLEHLIYWSYANPSSTAFMDRYLEKAGRAAAPHLGSLQPDLGAPQARRGGRRGRQVPRPRGLRLGRDPESDAQERKARQGGRRAPRPSASSSRRTCSSPAAARGCARRRKRPSPG